MNTDASGQPWTVLRLLDWTREYFARAGVDSPRLCAEILLAGVLGCKRVDLYARYNDQPTDDQRDDFRELVRRAGSGEPVAYLVGSKEFYSLAFTVTPEVLIPRPETEALVDLVVAHLRRLGRAGTCWDVGCGCGCIAVAVAANCPQATVLATDISPTAIAVAERNATDNGVADRVTCAESDLLNLPADWTGPETFDAIAANLPYIAPDEPIGPTVEHEPKLALYAGDDGLSVIRRLLPEVAGRLSDEGLFCMEFGFTHADAVRDLIVETGRLEEPEILEDHQQIERIAVTRKKTGSRHG